MNADGAGNRQNHGGQNHVLLPMIFPESRFWKFEPVAETDETQRGEATIKEDGAI